jgi:hypothetical protein
MAKKQTLSVSKYLAGKAKDMADIRATHKRIRDNKDKFELAFYAINIVAQRAQWDGKVWMSAEPSVWHSWNGDANLSVCCQIEMSDVTSLKEGRVPDTLAVAEKVGFEFDTTDDYAGVNYAQRSYRATGEFGGVRVRLTIVADIAKDSQQCKKVKTGTEIKEVDKFEIVCE